MSAPGTALAAVLLAVTLSASTSAAPTASRCDECGMTVNERSRFSARFISKDGVRSFCDIGDLLVFLNRTGANPAAAEVKDHASGDPVRADRAYYVQDDRKFRTPMRWGIAAFATREDASAQGPVRDLAAIREVVK